MSEKLPIDEIIEWDVENWGQLIRLWTPLLDTLPKGSKVLAIGERNGGLSTWLAMKGFEVCCTDRVYPTELAKANHAKHGLEGRITYAQFDVVHSDEAFYNRFDIVIAKSVIGGLKRVYSDKRTRDFSVQQQAVQIIYKCLKPGGYFFSAENLQGGYLGRLLRRFTGKDIGWLHLNWKELPELFSGWELVQLKAFGVVPGILFGNPVLKRLVCMANRYLLVFLPASAKYIGFIVARKAKS